MRVQERAAKQMQSTTWAGAVPAFSRRDYALGVALIAVFGALTLPFLYRKGMGEPDSIAMAVATYQGVLSGNYLGEPLLYIPEGQPLYYGVFMLLQRFARLPVLQLIFSMNLLSWWCSAVGIGLLYLVSRFYSNRVPATIAAVFVACSPVVLEYSTYGHPVSVSISAWLAGALFVLQAVRSLDNLRPRPAALWFIGAFLTLTSAGLLRADVYPLYPGVALLAAIAARVRPLRAGVLALAATVSALLASVVTAGLLVPAMTRAGGSNALERLWQIVMHFQRSIAVRDGLLELVFAFGLPSALLVAAALLVALLRGRWQILVILTVLVLPTWLFAAGNLQPARRFLHPLYATALLIPVLWHAAGFAKQSTASIAAICVSLLGTLLLPLAGRIAETRNSPLLKSHTIFRSTRSVLHHHRLNQAYVDWAHARLPDVISSAPAHTLYAGSFGSRNFVLLEHCRRAERIEILNLEQAPGSFLTHFTAGSKLFYTSEIVGVPASSIPNHDYPAIYLMERGLADSKAQIAGEPGLLLPENSAVAFKMYYSNR